MQTSKIRLLIIDVLFPDLHASWRANEINYFLSHPDFETDILISPSYHWAVTENMGDDLPTMFRKYYTKHQWLNNHNLFIFNPRFNGLNVFNKRINGMSTNGRYGGDFLLSTRTSVDWHSYDVCLCIFLTCRIHNQNLCASKLWPTVVKVYPGGGFTYNETEMARQLKQLEATSDTVIVTQDFVHSLVSKHVSRVIKTYLGPILAPQTPKRYKSNKRITGLDLCFTSFSNTIKKGYKNYCALVNHFKEYYPQLDIRFHLVGPSDPSVKVEGVICHGPMDPDQLNDFYHNVVDIIVSPVEVHEIPDGFPLGMEALIQGCIPIQCDPHGANSYYQYNDSNSLTTTSFDLALTDRFILDLYSNPSKRIAMSKANVDKSFDIVHPDKTLLPIANLCRKLAINNRVAQFASRIPADVIGGCPIDKCQRMANLIVERGYTNCIEIGVWRGRSLCALAIGTAITGGMAIGIDPYTSINIHQKDCGDQVAQLLNSTIPKINFDQVYQQVTHLFKSHDNVRIVRKAAQDVDVNKDVPKIIDFLHIDGNHDTALVTIDIEMFVPLVRSGGLVVMDDTDWPSVIKCLDLLKQYATLLEDHGGWQVWSKK